MGYAVDVVDWERLAPVSLTREYGVAQTVVDLPCSYTPFLNLLEHGRDGLLDIETVEEFGIYHFALFGVV